MIYTGRHIQQTKMFDNQLPVDPEPVHRGADGRQDAARCGLLHRLQGQVAPHQGIRDRQKLGHPTKIFTEEMEAYGFSDYFGVGDIIAHDRGGYKHDGIISAMGVSWLRGRAATSLKQARPGSWR